MDRRNFLKLLGLGAVSLATSKFIFDYRANLYKLESMASDIIYAIVAVNKQGDGLLLDYSANSEPVKEDCRSDDDWFGEYISNLGYNTEDLGLPHPEECGIWLCKIQLVVYGSSNYYEDDYEEEIKELEPPVEIFDVDQALFQFWGYSKVKEKEETETKEVIKL